MSHRDDLCVALDAIPSTKKAKVQKVQIHLCDGTTTLECLARGRFIDVILTECLASKQDELETITICTNDGCPSHRQTLDHGEHQVVLVRCGLYPSSITVALVANLTISRLQEYNENLIAFTQQVDMLCLWHLCNYLGIPMETIYGLIKYVYEHATDPKTLVTAYCALVHHPYPIILRMNLSTTFCVHIPNTNRRDIDLFMAVHYPDSIDEKEPVSVSFHDASSILGVPMELVKQMDTIHNLVIAGGGPMALILGPSAMLPSSDVDMFVLNSCIETAITVLHLLKTNGYILARLGNGVVSCLHVDLCTIQVIMTDAVSSAELVTSFDMYSIKCYYTNECVYRTFGAKKDHMTMRCSDGNTTVIKPNRLAKLRLKGFNLSEDATAFLSVSDTKDASTLKYDFVKIHATMSMDETRCLLCRYGLYVVDTTIEDLCKSLKAIVHTGDFQGYHGKMEEAPVSIYNGTSIGTFLSGVSVSSVQLKFIGIPSSNLPILIESLMLVHMGKCHLSFTPDQDKEIFVFEIVDEGSIDSFASIADGIVQKFGDDEKYSFKENRYKDVHIRFLESCKYYKNGILLAKNSQRVTGAFSSRGTMFKDIVGIPYSIGRSTGKLTLHVSIVYF
jgi:hypothetical protein